MTEHADDQFASFGERLRRCREAAGLSQEQLAERAGLSSNAIGQLERSERRYPHPNTVALLAQALDLSPTERTKLSAVASRPHLASSSAASASPSSLRSSLPGSLTPLVGRQRALAGIAASLRRPDVRLLTLTGPGGVGKTSLAVEAARLIAPEFRDGVAYVALGALRSSDLVPATVAQAVGLRDARKPINELNSYLQDKQLLLVLDNLEHLLSAAPIVTSLLSACPGLRVLATSRAPLRLSGEHEFPVLALDVPSGSAGASVQDLLVFSAVQLFVQRAQAVAPDFELSNDNLAAVVRICTELGGLPLALELAAVRIRLLSPHSLATRLQHPLDVLTAGKRDAPPRQRTLRDTIAWSYNLLGPVDQAVFRHLGIFVGGWSLEAAEAVCAPADHSADAESPNVLESLGTLVEGNLVQPAEDGPSKQLRYRFLETVHGFARERLMAGGQTEAAARVHARYFLDLAEARAPALAAGQRAAGLLDQLEADHPNFRSALDWFLEQGKIDSGVRLGAALWRFWFLRGHLTEGRDRLGRLLDLGAQQQTVARARALLGAGAITYYHGERPRGGALCQAAVELGRALGDSETLAWALIYQAWIAIDSSDHSEGRAYSARAGAEEALQLCRELEDRQGMALALLVIAMSYGLAGNLHACVPYAEQGLTVARELDDRWDIAWALRWLAAAAVERRDFAAARALHDEGIPLLRELGDPRHLGATLWHSGWAFHEQGDWDEARRHYREALKLATQIGDRAFIAMLVMNFAGLLACEGRAERALSLAGSATAAFAEIGYLPAPLYLGLYDRWLEPARRAIGPQVAALLLQGGEAMTLDVAVASALAD